MLLKFYFSNYKSINHEVEFNMFAGSYKRHSNHLVKFQKKDVLRSSAIYGTNGSGKTNILLALSFLQNLITKGTLEEKPLNIPVFKLADCKNKPTKFEIDFLVKKNRFNYKLEFLNGYITSERLVKISENSEKLIFNRITSDNKTKLTINPNEGKSEKETYREEFYSEELRNNQTFFKEGINKKLNGFDLPYSWFENILRFISLDTQFAGIAHTFLTDKKFLAASKEIISKANVGISDFKLLTYSKLELKSLGYELPKEMEQMLLGKDNFGADFEISGELFSAFKNDKNELEFVKISTIHIDDKGNEVEFKFSEESKGVQRLFELLPAIHRTLHKGKVFIIDEIETSFHPVLIKEILKLYFKNNPSMPGQIIFTTHESHLLDLELFRQDEIWFCEKAKNGETRLYSLSEFKPRFDKDVRKGYLEGQFSYIPFLGSKNQLL
ncbi:AAA family ATPase [Tenacibaculum finnmarkense]|uniref:AAA family ATPase n=1 Tax=Tenacibaculum finnmarkense genomovar finnmarkense TaxID=1458503 RepID=A0AAP1WGM1_9FLAO|nr:ATP-binding protein [Tenacibaculum finnmarkense]MBE7653190.1 AAA family ATPase [Tenacibaculum finnmarkense genomovar finnmarkense]MBE7695440.1 AAA family ATPase [Tenacibaculum finnmarkense genomovar finnmarkense]MCD8427572.1 ATP-binding protein [Tenacibaculum finnmarkense genomovar finnmarkense]MCD8439719.1 ATP-binding protein [Tenacibaculum finnmarkense genomovar ulcerans]MCG8720567.1 ATP-binding protein [Tenacibaculum finnmarkense]